MALVVACVGACRAQIADLGGPDPCAGDAGAPLSCRYAGPYSDGSGIFGGVPQSCSDADGLPITSEAQVATAIVGVWTGCGTSGPYPGSQASGVQFGSDGTFSLLDEDYTTSSVVPSSDPARSGTFTIVDASSTLGHGTFQVRFTAADGGVSLVQVAVLGSPPKLRFFVPGATDFVPALTWAFRAGVCGPGFGPPATCMDNEKLLARMQGRWIWCSGPNSGPAVVTSAPPQMQPTPIGLEVNGSQWTLLFEDASGAVVPDPGMSGTLQLGPDGRSGSTWTNGGSMLINPWLPMIDACGRAMLLEPTHICQLGQSAPCSVDVSASGLFVRLP